MNTELIPFTLTGEYSLALAPDAEARRAELLDAAKLVADKIKTPLEYAAARNARESLAAARISIEKTRVEVKQPILDKGAEIDGTAKLFVAPIKDEEARLKRAMDDYAAEQRRIEQERLEKARAEAKAAEDARLEAERKQREAEEAERRAQIARDNAETLAQNKKAAAAEDAARKQREESEAAQRQQQEAARQAQQTAAVAVNTFVPSGAKEVLDYEVTDIRQLLDTNPALVDLTPRRKLILEKINALNKAGLPLFLPGIKIISTTTTR